MALIGTSLQAKVYTALYTNLIADANISVSSSTLQGRTESVLDFNSGDGINARDLEMGIQLAHIARNNTLCMATIMD